MRAAAGPAAAAVALVLMVGCGSNSTARPAATAASIDPGQPAGPSAAADPSATAGDVRLEVTGFHVYPLPAGDVGATRAAAAFGVPVAQVAQMHLLMTLVNVGGADRSVASDDVRLILGAVTVEPATTDTFPPAALHPGEQSETAVGFDVAVRGGSGAVTLRWTHDGRSTVIPIGAAQQAG